MQNYTAWFAEQDAKTKMFLMLGGGLIVFLVVYWFIVRFTGKNMSKGTSFNDSKTTPWQSGGGGGLTMNDNQSQLLANEIALALDYTWGFGNICGDPDNICEKLQRLINGNDDFKRTVGKAYQNANGKNLSQAIKDNPCGCTKAAWFGRDTKFPVDKNMLIQQLQKLGL
jgi:hypothetical protein